MAPIYLFLLGIGLMIFFMAVKIVKEYERLVVFRLGRLIGSKGPGFVLVIPFIDTVQKVSTRMIAMDVPPQDVITKDNVSIKVNAVLYFRIVDPAKSVVDVENYLFATSQLAQTTLRSILGQAELDELLTNRDKINDDLQQIIDSHTDPWGVKVSLVEVKHVDLPPEMQRAMAKQAEAERERRAKVIHAEGEFQASEKLAEAAGIMSKNPVTVQLRFLQTLTEVASENNSTLIFPVPVDLLSAWMDRKPSA